MNMGWCTDESGLSAQIWLVVTFSIEAQLQEAVPSRVGNHTPHFTFRNTAVERGGAFGRPSGFQNVVHHLIAHPLSPSRRRTFATFPYLIYGRRKRCPVHHLDRHQTPCAHDGGRAKQRGRPSNKKISAASRAKSWVHRRRG